MAFTKLSVNINKWATLRNARGGNNPNIVETAIKVQAFGANGVTVHPRPDERHITYQDVFDIKKVTQTELNIEGNPREQKFIDLVLATKPTQVTLVPDALNQLTSNHGWDTEKHSDFLKEIIALFQKENIRTSIFLDPNPSLIPSAKRTGTDRIELYTEAYAKKYSTDKNEAIAPYILTAEKALEYELGLNAGHDLDLENLAFFAKEISNLLEVSIGHALICDSINLGLENTVQLYKRQLNEHPY